MRPVFSCVIYILSEPDKKPRGKINKLMKGGSIMRFRDVQDLTKATKSEQRETNYDKMHDEFLSRLSVFDFNKRMTIFGASFIF